MNTKLGKQNRVITAILTILIAAVVTLVAVTAGANRKAKPSADPEPPVGEKYSDQNSEPSSPLRKPAAGDEGDAREAGTAAGKTAETEKLDEKLNPSPKEDENDADRDTAAIPTSAEADIPEEVPVPADSGLPKFRAPLENAVAVKSCSLSVPVFSATMDDYRVHTGIDFACAPGTPVLAAADGTVTSFARDPMMGWTVTVEHEGGAVTRYKGLSEESGRLVTPGDKVIAGQVIGASGETALVESAEGDHLHFELSVNGKTVDPAEYMDVVTLSGMYED